MRVYVRKFALSVLSICAKMHMFMRMDKIAAILMRMGMSMNMVNVRLTLNQNSMRMPLVVMRMKILLRMTVHMKAMSVIAACPEALDKKVSTEYKNKKARCKAKPGI
jgi:hypothetical protein